MVELRPLRPKNPAPRLRKRRRRRRLAYEWIISAALCLAVALAAATGVICKKRLDVPTVAQVPTNATNTPAMPPLPVPAPSHEELSDARALHPTAESFAGLFGAALTPAAPPPDKPVRIGGFKYRKEPADWGELRRQLVAAPPIGLELPPDDPLVRDLIRLAKEQRGPARDFHPLAMAVKDIHELPLRMAGDCQLPQPEAEVLQARSRRLREILADLPDVATLRKQLVGVGSIWQQPSAVPTLVQMMQAEREEYRRFLVKLLADIGSREALRGLVGRAVFDVSRDVRHAAVEALATFRRSDYRDVLLAVLTHPWPAAADFAATALVRLNDRDAVPALVALLDAPDPAAPYMIKEGPSETYYRRELVRLNHKQNCLVCHAASFDPSHLVRAAVHNPKVPPPPRYYQSPPDPNQLMVRADVTYLRQDFSFAYDLERYDFCVRTRRLSKDEYETARQRPVANPQRAAILFALRELTGEDPGDTSDAWKALLKRRPF